MRGRLGALSVFVLLCFALAGSTAAPSPASSASALSVREGIAALLEKRSVAVIEGDKDAFMSTVAGFSGDFVDRQSRLFDSMMSLDLASYELTLAWDRFGDLARRSDRARYPRGAEVLIPLTEERYRIRGFDPEPAAEDMFYTFVRVAGSGWKIAEDTDLEDIALYSARHLWDFGPIEAVPSEHFLLLTHPCGDRPEGSTGGCQPGATGLTSVAERAIQQLDEYWTLSWPGKVAVLVPGSTDELARMIQATFSLDTFVAFAYSTVDVANELDFTGHRIMVNPESFLGRPEDEVHSILVHELAHIASRPTAGPFIPLFVEEGIAEYIGNDGRPALDYLDSRVASGQFDRRLPKDFEFTTGGAEAIYTSYQEGQSAVRFFIDRWGFDRFLEFYRRIGKPRVDPGLAGYHFDKALRDVVGIGVEQFERAWASSISGS